MTKPNRITALRYIAISMLAASLLAGTSCSQGNITYAYSSWELLGLGDHPVVFEEVDSAIAFYNNVGDSRVQVTSIHRKAEIERSFFENPYKDKNILYLTEDSTHANFIGTVKINAFVPELYSGMNLDDAITLLVNYLPGNFLKYYKTDSAYVYGNDKTQIYTCAFRLNAAGESYRATTAPQYPYYYYLKIIAHNDTGMWEMETGYSAYGGKGVDWIGKYAEPWEVDLSSYREWDE